MERMRSVDMNKELENTSLKETIKILEGNWKITCN